MSIRWINGWKAGCEEFVGCVLNVGFRERRTMSDVWDDEQFAEVWDGEKVRDIVLTALAYLLPDGSCLSYEEWDKNRDYDLVKNAVTITSDGVAQTDASEEVRDLATQWYATNHRIHQTASRLRQAIVPQYPKIVRVIKGRKLPTGGEYEVTGSFNGSYGETVNLRDQGGKNHTYINTENLEVVDPLQYVGGPVACKKCRKDFYDARSAGMIAGRHAVALCWSCRVELALQGKEDLPLPSSAINPLWKAFCDQPALTGTEAEGIVREIAEHPQEKGLWSILADWLEDNGQTNRATFLRAALFGKTKEKAKPIRKKDLVLGEWMYDIGQSAYYHHRRAELTGFPPQKVGGLTYDLIVVRQTRRSTPAGVDSRWVNTHLALTCKDRPGQTTDYFGGVLRRQVMAFLKDKGVI